ncbi:MAG: hypothetical protein WB919_04495 [Candidatus Sulfotelmatobacter sp.]
MGHTICNSTRALKRLLVLLFFCGLLQTAIAADWNEPAQTLARKIVAVTGPGAVAITVENRSSLAKKDSDTITSALRLELEALGARPVKPEQAAASVTVALSENPQFYVWVAQIQQGAESTVVMVSVPREAEAGFAHESMPMSLRKIPLWTQEDRILDVAILEEDSAPKAIAVLDGEKVAIDRLKNGKWQREQSLGIAHARPWPKDLRGRVLAAKDHLLDVYLPGVFCRTTGSPLALNCRESDDPWPLIATAASFPSSGFASAVQPLGAFYSASRNFFTGALAPGIGKLTTVGKFYSAAPLPRPNYALWLFAGTDGQVHLVDGVTDRVANLGWGSDIASVKAACGSGWQVLATGALENKSGNDDDSVKLYEIPDRDPVPVSAALDFSGKVTALWTEGKGDSAIAVVRNKETGEYEAFRVAVGCSQ